MRVSPLSRDNSSIFTLSTETHAGEKEEEKSKVVPENNALSMKEEDESLGDEEEVICLLKSN